MAEKIYNHPIHGQVDLKLHLLADEKGYNHSLRDYWEINNKYTTYAKVTKAFKVDYYNSVEKGRHQFLVVEDNLIAALDFTSKYITAETRTVDRKTHDAFIKKLRKLFPEVPEPIDESVRLRFWFSSTNGPAKVSRKISVPDWADIKDNYDKDTKATLTYLMEGFKPSSAGQLILWHGEPGTGKTYALRSLLKSWREWCTGEYILDPEALFGYSPGYLVQLLLSGYVSDIDDDDEPVEGVDNRWRLLILEDTGELLTETAKERSGQGLSRLLNLVDGLIGQGLKVMVLITTNEQFNKLHPAVSRQGRCLASIDFKPLSTVEAQSWAERHKLKVTDFKNLKYTLAELYSHTKEAVPILNNENVKELGFKFPK